MTDKTKKIHPPPRSEPPDSGDAFVPDVARQHGPIGDDSAESFAEEFIASATSAEFVAEEARDELITEELGGPFLELNSDEVEVPNAEGSEGEEPTKEPAHARPRRGGHRRPRGSSPR